MKIARFKWSFVGNVLIAVVSEGQFAEAEFEAFLRDMKVKPFTKLLAATTGVLDVGSAQRKRINEIVKQKQIAVTLITDQSIVRGMATAASWVGINVAAFSWADMEAAAAHVEPPAGSIQAERVLQELIELKAGLSK